MTTRDRDADGDQLLAFYSEQSPDSRGRMLKDVWALNLEQLEDSHDYIQWLFPSFARSGAQPHSPVLSQRAADVIARSAEIRERFIRSAEVMARFYGFTLIRADTAWSVTLSESFKARRGHWVTPRNHNYLRHTRIMKSLALVGLAPLARAWLECLQQVYAANQSVVGSEALSHWVNAIGDADVMRA